MLTTGEGISKSQKLNDTIHDKASTYILYVYINFCDLLNMLIFYRCSGCFIINMQRLESTTATD